MVLTTAQRRVAAAMSEDDGPDSLEAHVRQLINDLNLWGFHPRISIGSTKGWPDWVIIGQRTMLFRELKRQTACLSLDQRAVGSLLVQAGQNWAVWRPADLLDGTIERQLREIA